MFVGAGSPWHGRRSRSPRSCPRSRPNTKNGWATRSNISFRQGAGCFSKLHSDKERDVFIEAFWKQRDPTGHTRERIQGCNTILRLQLADQTFRTSAAAGRKTPAGRLYIVTGGRSKITRPDFSASESPRGRRSGIQSMDHEDEDLPKRLGRGPWSFRPRGLSCPRT